jgi:hypothetical protein
MLLLLDCLVPGFGSAVIPSSYLPMGGYRYTLLVVYSGYLYVS